MGSQNPELMLVPKLRFTAIKLRVAISQRRECKACLARIYR